MSRKDARWVNDTRKSIELGRVSAEFLTFFRALEEILGTTGVRFTQLASPKRRHAYEWAKQL